MSQTKNDSVTYFTYLFFYFNLFMGISVLRAPTEGKTGGGYITQHRIAPHRGASDAVTDDHGQRLPGQWTHTTGVCVAFGGGTGIATGSAVVRAGDALRHGSFG